MAPTEIPMDELEEIAFKTGARLELDGVRYKVVATINGKRVVFTAHKPVEMEVTA